MDFPTGCRSVCVPGLLHFSERKKNVQLVHFLREVHLELREIPHASCPSSLPAPPAHSAPSPRSARPPDQALSLWRVRAARTPRLYQPSSPLTAATVLTLGAAGCVAFEVIDESYPFIHY